MGMACRTRRERRNSYRVLVGKPEGYRPAGGTSRRRWEDGIRVDGRKKGRKNKNTKYLMLLYQTVKSVSYRHASFL
jgi:hypothetical protein